MRQWLKRMRASASGFPAVVCTICDKCQAFGHWGNQQLETAKKPTEVPLNWSLVLRTAEMRKSKLPFSILRPVAFAASFPNMYMPPDKRDFRCGSVWIILYRHEGHADQRPGISPDLNRLEQDAYSEDVQAAEVLKYLSLSKNARGKISAPLPP